MSEGHFIINPLPAYGRDGTLSKPDKYKEELAGAVVQMSFSICHQFLGGNIHSDNYYADIRKIQVLRAP